LKAGISSGEIDEKRIEELIISTDIEDDLIQIAEDMVQKRYSSAYGKKLNISIYLINNDRKGLNREFIFLQLVINHTYITEFYLIFICFLVSIVAL
jgi:hypothetical protein